MTQWREGESVMWWHDFGRYEAMVCQEVGDGSVGPSGQDGWTNEMHCY
jgi:hypothetical protein